MLPEQELRARRPLFGRVWVLAAAAVLLLSAMGVVALAVGDDDSLGPGPRLNVGVAGSGGGDHWHVAFGVYRCDHFVAEPVVRGGDWPDPTGIHTHDDGFIHIHPFTPSAAGDGARLGLFFETMGLTFTSRSIEMTNGSTLQTGDQCNGRPATLKVAQFDMDALDRPPEIITSDLPDICLRDRRALTIALVADGTAIRLPPSASQFDESASVGSLPLFPTTTRR